MSSVNRVDASRRSCEYYPDFDWSSCREYLVKSLEGCKLVMGGKENLTYVLNLTRHFRLVNLIIFASLLVEASR